MEAERLGDMLRNVKQEALVDTYDDTLANGEAEIHCNTMVELEAKALVDTMAGT